MTGENETAPACRYCGRQSGYPCRNTRDMEDFAISGDDVCYGALIDLGGGEKGLRYVRLNREAIKNDR